MTVPNPYALAGRAMINHFLLALVVLLGHIYIASPITTMLLINLSGMVLALAISVFVLRLLFSSGSDLKSFSSIWFRWFAGGMLFFVLWGVFWSIGEEVLVLWRKHYGYDGDMGASYFYTNLSGMGYADGLLGVWKSILKMSVLGVISSLVAIPFCYLGVVARRGVGCSK